MRHIWSALRQCFNLIKLPPWLCIVLEERLQCPSRWEDTTIGRQQRTLPRAAYADTYCLVAGDKAIRKLLQFMIF